MSFILKSAVKMKECEELKVFISPYLSKEDNEVENNCLKKRRNLIDQAFDSSAIRRRKLMLEVLQGKQWISLKDSEVGKLFETGRSSTNQKTFE